MTDVEAGLPVASGEMVAYLEALAAELSARDYDARLVLPAGRRPYLHVRNRQASVLTENVVIEAGWFWYSWAQRIGPVSDVPAAAGKIVRVLRAIGSD